MSDIHVRYLVIGGGVAGGAAVEAIRQIDQQGEILLVGQEINRPYYRRLLGTKYLLGMRHEELYMEPTGWYVAHQISLHTGRTASHLDVSRQVVTLDNGAEISFDRLLIATGASPQRMQIPGADLPNVYYLRSIEEADRLRHAADKSLREGRGRASVIGGGLLAVELATTLRQMGLEVDLICEQGHLLAPFAGENVGGLVSRIVSNKGVKVHTKAWPARFEGDGRVQRVLLDNGEMIAANLVLGATGIAPNKQILRATPIRSETAILTDEHGRTNVPEIFAAGECAAIFDPLFGKHRLLEHESSAMETGRLAGRNMAGLDETYSAVNAFGSGIFGVDVAVWGERRLVNRRVVRGSGHEENPSLVELGVDHDGRLVQIVAVGAAVDREVLPELIRRRVRLDGNEEAIKDPAFDLRTLLR